MIFKNFPMPPTSNKLYTSVRGRLIKSAEARNFDLKAQRWAYVNNQAIQALKLNLEAIRANGGCFKLTVWFIFDKSSVFTKKGELKKLDHSNRIKQTHDMIAKIIGYDDSLFVHTEEFKVYCDRKEDEQVIFKIEQANIKHIEDLGE